MVLATLLEQRGSEERTTTKETADVYIEAGVGWAVCSDGAAQSTTTARDSAHLYILYSTEKGVS